MSHSIDPEPQSPSDEVARLLAVGLDAYGMGEVSEAMIAWREVLRLDPGNREALDYIQAADRRQRPDVPSLAADAEAGARGPEDALLREGRAVLHRGDFEAALDLFQSAADSNPSNADAQGYVDMLRSRLFKLYRARLGELVAAPELRVEPSAITGYNLPKDAGFVLSLVDGRTPLSDVISLSGMDAFEALRIVQGLVDAEIVSMRT